MRRVKWPLRALRRRGAGRAANGVDADGAGEAVPGFGLSVEADPRDLHC
jgi:hypothetical protein